MDECKPLPNIPPSPIATAAPTPVPFHPEGLRDVARHVRGMFHLTQQNEAAKCVSMTDAALNTVVDCPYVRVAVEVCERERGQQLQSLRLDGHYVAAQVEFDSMI